MNISITGTLGSGKSSVCKLLEKKGFEIISNGVLFRKIAEEKGVSVVELNELAKTDKSIDKMLDDRSTQLGKEKDNAVFDARMGWHFVKDSFKIFLLVDINESARRVYNDNRVSETYESVDKAKADLMKRQLLEKERYNNLYGVDYLNLNNYDLVIESTSATPEQEIEAMLNAFENYCEGKKSVLLNPTSILVPSKLLKEDADCQCDCENDEIVVELVANKFSLVSGFSKLKKALNDNEVYVSVKVMESKSYLSFSNGGLA